MTATTALPVTALIGVVLLLAGCETRVPIDAALARAHADNLCLREGLPWGDPVEVLAPTLRDAQGRRWWQVGYAEPPLRAADTATASAPSTASALVRAQPRVVLVDAESGWAIRPPREALIRLSPAQPLPRPVPSASGAALVQDGSWILVLVDAGRANGERIGDLAREAARLNDLGVRTGLYPLFSVHTDRQGVTWLVYGWQGDRGIARDERITAWVASRTEHSAARFVDLAAR